MMNNVERRDLIKRMPFIAYLASPERCDFVLPVKLRTSAALADPAAYDVDARTCANSTRWRFTALRTSGVRDGHYCTVHLVRTCFANPRERARWVRTVERLAGGELYVVVPSGGRRTR